MFLSGKWGSRIRTFGMGLGVFRVLSISWVCLFIVGVGWFQVMGVLVVFMNGLVSCSVCLLGSVILFQQPCMVSCLSVSMLVVVFIGVSVIFWVMLFLNSSIFWCWRVKAVMVVRIFLIGCTSALVVSSWVLQVGQFLVLVYSWVMVLFLIIYGMRLMRVLVVVIRYILLLVHGYMSGVISVLSWSTVLKCSMSWFWMVWVIMVCSFVQNTAVCIEMLTNWVLLVCSWCLWVISVFSALLTAVWCYVWGIVMRSGW